MRNLRQLRRTVAISMTAAETRRRHSFEGTGFKQILPMLEPVKQACGARAA